MTALPVRGNRRFGAQVRNEQGIPLDAVPDPKVAPGNPANEGAARRRYQRDRVAGARQRIGAGQLPDHRADGLRARRVADRSKRLRAPHVPRREDDGAGCHFFTCSGSSPVSAHRSASSGVSAIPSPRSISAKPSRTSSSSSGCGRTRGAGFGWGDGVDIREGYADPSVLATGRVHGPAGRDAAVEQSASR